MLLDRTASIARRRGLMTVSGARCAVQHSYLLKTYDARSFQSASVAPLGPGFVALYYDHDVMAIRAYGSRHFQNSNAATSRRSGPDSFPGEGRIAAII